MEADQAQKKFDRIMFVRRGSNVKRCHTQQIIGEYLVGQHTYGVIALIFELEQQPSMNLIKAALIHDSPECYTGDLPAPIKWANEKFAHQLNMIEKGILKSNNLPAVEFLLTEQEQNVLAWADTLDLLFFSLEQIQLGNNNMKIVAKNCCSHLQTKLKPHDIGLTIMRLAVEMNGEMSTW